MGWCSHFLVQAHQRNCSLGATASPPSLNALGQGIMVYLEQRRRTVCQVSPFTIHQAGTPSNTVMFFPMLSFNRKDLTKSVRITCSLLPTIIKFRLSMMLSYRSATRNSWYAGNAAYFTNHPHFSLCCLSSAFWSFLFLPCICTA